MTVKEYLTQVYRCANCPNSNYEMTPKTDEVFCMELRREVPMYDIPENCPLPNWNNKQRSANAKGRQGI